MITGDFSGIATFGPDEPGQTIITVAGSEDMYVARYNSDGMLIWVKSAGGSSQDRGYGITALSDDSVVVTGFFREIATFGQGDPDQTVLTSAGWADIFIARYDIDGTLQWAKRAGSNEHDWANDITVLSDDSFVVAGEFRSTATFGSEEVNQTVLSSAGDRDIFIARYSSDGSLQWAKRAGGSSYDGGYAITACSDNSTVISGFFAGNVTFGHGEANQTSLQTAGGVDIFIAKYNLNGTLAWAKRAGGTRDDLAQSITTLSDDSIVITGYYEDSATFGGGEPNETILTNYGNSRVVYAARYNTDGTLQWVKRAGGTNTDTGYGITTLSDDSLIVTGHVRSSPATFGEGEPNETIVILEEGAMDDVFVARFKSDGSLNWVKTAGSVSVGSMQARDFGIGATALSDNSSVIVGNFMLSSVFGKDESNETTLDTAGNTDIFVARFEP